MPFRCHAKKFFITYSRCDKLPEDLLLFLLDKFPHAVEVHTVQETHADGGSHLHAGVRCSRQHDIKSAEFLDWDGSHPSIEAAKHWGKCLSYLSKEGQLHSFESTESDDTDEIPDAAAFGTKAEYLHACIRSKIQYGYANELWRLHNSINPPVITDDDVIEGTIQPPLDRMVLENEGKSTLLLGASGIGKTTWAKKMAPKPCLFVSHIDDLKYLTDGIRSIIFDDMDFSHWPRTSQIHLADSENGRSINIRYGTVRIPAGMVKIFTCNMRCLLYDEAINRRLNIIEI